MIPGVEALRGISLALSPIFQLSELGGGGLGPKSNFTQNSQERTTINTGLGRVYTALCDAM